MADIATYNVCKKHRLGRGCADHCHIMNDCDPCYAVMENTAEIMLRKAREYRRTDCGFCDAKNILKNPNNECENCGENYNTPPFIKCNLCGYGDHCPDCNACDYDDDDCKNIFCEADLID